MQKCDWVLSGRKAGSLASKYRASDLVESTLPAPIAKVVLLSGSESLQGQQVHAGEQNSLNDMLDTAECL